MLLFSIVMTLFFVLDFLNACSEQKETDRGKTKVASEDVENVTKEAIDTVKTYIQRQKKEYLSRMEANSEAGG
jgi:hypothetical protein